MTWQAISARPRPVARHVIDTHLHARFSNLMASDDVASIIRQAHPSVFSDMVSYDVSSNTCLALIVGMYANIKPGDTVTLTDISPGASVSASPVSMSPMRPGHADGHMHGTGAGLVGRSWQILPAASLSSVLYTR